MLSLQSPVHHQRRPPFWQRPSLADDLDALAAADHHNPADLLAAIANSHVVAEDGSLQHSLHAFSSLQSQMSSALAYQNPAIRIQQSTPVPQIPSSTTTTSSSASYDASPALLAADGYSATRDAWSAFPHAAVVSTSGAQRSQPLQQTLSSSSTSSASIPTSNPTAQLMRQGAALTQPYFPGLADNSPPASSVNKVESSYRADQASVPFSNHHLPTPSDTPTTESFLNPAAPYHQTFDPQGQTFSAMATHYGLKHTLLDPDDDVPGHTHSSRQSVSSYGNSPATPRTVADDFDDRFKAPTNGETIHDAVDTWMDEYLRFGDDIDMLPTDAATPESYSGFYTAAQHAGPRLHTQHAIHQQQQKHLSPLRNSIMVDRLQAAQMARSSSPTSATSRAVSPFKHGSPYALPSHSFEAHQQRFAPHFPDQHDAAAKAFAFQGASQSRTSEQRTTISPREALKQYDEDKEDAKMPLLPEDDSPAYSQAYSATTSYQTVPAPVLTSAPESSYDLMVTDSPTWSDARQYGSAFPTTTTAPQVSYGFMAPSIPASMQMNGNMMGFSTPLFRPGSAPLRQESTPEFPAHLTSMESSASEAGGPQDGNGSGNSSRASRSAAETGTYSCTYRGCPLRFETHQKLQKHKREAHRQHAPNVTTGIGSGMSAEELQARNSQAGPHKCERINPNTGKPCNLSFSRPYDLTRHEDATHNPLKVKIRCPHCVEEKTFSRKDALSRHMRLSHPEIEFPGKNRRRRHGSLH